MKNMQRCRKFCSATEELAALQGNVAALPEVIPATSSIWKEHAALQEALQRCQICWHQLFEDCVALQNPCSAAKSLRSGFLPFYTCH